MATFLSVSSHVPHSSVHLPRTSTPLPSFPSRPSRVSLPRTSPPSLSYHPTCSNLDLVKKSAELATIIVKFPEELKKLLKMKWDDQKNDSQEKKEKNDPQEKKEKNDSQDKKEKKESQDEATIVIHCHNFVMVGNIYNGDGEVKKEAKEDIKIESLIEEEKTSIVSTGTMEKKNDENVTAEKSISVVSGRKTERKGVTVENQVEKTG